MPPKHFSLWIVGETVSVVWNVGLGVTAVVPRNSKTRNQCIGSELG